MAKTKLLKAQREEIETAFREKVIKDLKRKRDERVITFLRKLSSVVHKEKYGSDFSELPEGVLDNVKNFQVVSSDGENTVFSCSVDEDLGFRCAMALTGYSGWRAQFTVPDHMMTEFLDALRVYNESDKSIDKVMVVFLQAVRSSRTWEELEENYPDIYKLVSKPAVACDLPSVVNWDAKIAQTLKEAVETIGS